MSSNNPTGIISIAVIGAGLSGNLICKNILEGQTDKHIRVLQFDRYPENRMGPAYPENSECLLLNVPASRMSAVPDKPDHFLNWLQQKNVVAGPWDFVPRYLYRLYIQELLETAQKNKNSNTEYFRYIDEAIHVEKITELIKIRTLSGRKFEVHYLILALGNAEPAAVSLPDMSYTMHPNYFSSSWNENHIAALDKNADIFLIGTGQSTTDVIVQLARNQHKGRIYAISRKGLWPAAQNVFEKYPDFSDELYNKPLPVILHTVRHHIRQAGLTGLSANQVIDSLRPHTQRLWMEFSLTEKRQFVTYLSRYWEIFRSRIPPANASTLHSMIGSQKLQVIRGRISKITCTSSGFQIHFMRGDASADQVKVQYLINTTGPQSDYRKIQDPLVQQMSESGYITTDPLHLGLNATPEGLIIDRNGQISDNTMTLGSSLRGILWESVGAAEIRDQAIKLANKIIHAT